jgi:hypothetical protein
MKKESALICVICGEKTRAIAGEGEASCSEQVVQKWIARVMAGVGWFAPEAHRLPSQPRARIAGMERQIGEEDHNREDSVT